MEKKFDDDNDKNKDKNESKLLRNLKDIILEGNEHEPGCIYIKLFIYAVCFYLIGIVFYHLVIK